MTNQNSVTSSYHNEIVNPEQRDRGAALIKNDVIGGLECSNGTVRSVSLWIIGEISRHRPPTSDVVPIEASFDYQNPVGLFHDRVIERDLRQFAETFT